MNRLDPSSEHPIERDAAEWVLRLQKRPAPADEAAFSRWLALDPRHEEIFTEMNETAVLLDRLRRSEPTLPLPFPVQTSRLRYRRWLAAGSLAAAAAIAIGYTTWWLPLHAAYSDIVSTEVGGFRRVELPDGSVIQLNTQSSVDVRYSGSERRVRLTTGEAFFTVAKNLNRPFYVEAGSVAVRAVGTAFNVRRRTEGVEVTVTEGRVKVDQSPLTSTDATGQGRGDMSSRPELFLVAGQRTLLTFPAAAQLPAMELPPAPVVAIVPEDLTRTLAWTENRLQFSSTPLADIIAEFNRYNRTQLVLGDATLAAERFGGSFTPTGYDSFLELLEQSFGITVERRGEEIILRRAL